jgi:hypothetical protein
MDIRNIKEHLLKSPLFNLSLSSKELFHSNFLYWVAKNYPTSFANAFRPFLNDPNQHTKLNNVEREKHNIDLTLNYDDGQIIYVENKIKSVPYREQLKQYSKNHNPKNCYLLLSLSRPSFFGDSDILLIGRAKWQYLSYAQLNKLLKICLDEITDTYHIEIIKDYQMFVNGLVEINSLTQIDRNSLFNFHSTAKDINYKELKELRLHDFYLKKKYELLAYSVYTKLKSRNNNLIEFGAPLDWDLNEPTIYLGYGMSRAQGLMDLKYIISNGFALGIQIQGEHYRMVIEDNNGRIANKLKSDLDNGIWFNFYEKFPKQRVYPNPAKGFNKFGSVFFYKSVKLGTNRTVESIVSTILKDVERIEKNITAIKEKIKKANNG